MPNDKVVTGLERSLRAEPCLLSNNTSRVGWLVVENGVPLVDFAGNPGGPMPARWLASINLDGLAGRDCELLLVFEAGRMELPVVVGALAPAALELTFESTPSSVSLDGRRVELEAVDELVLRCGEASLTLRRNGRVVLRGVQVEMRARARARITGSTVEIN